MEKYYVLLVVLMSSMISLAQEDAYFTKWTAADADRVKQEFRRSTNDSLKMKMARSIGLYYQEINRDTSFYYTKMEIELAKKLRQPFWEADAHEAAGWLLSQLKNYPLSIEYLLKAQRLAEDKNTEKNIWQLPLFSAEGNAGYARLTTLGFIHNNLSQLYHQTGDTANEIKEITLGINIGQQIGNELLLALLKSNLAQHYLKKGIFDSVIIYGKQSLEHMHTSNYKTYEGYQLALLGNGYIQKGDLATAKIYLDSSVVANQKNGSIIKLPDAYFSYANLYKLKQQPDSAIYWLKKTIEAFTHFNQPEKVKRAYGELYQLYKEGNRADSAYHYLRLYQPLNDSLYQLEKDQIYASQNFAFNTQVEQQQQESKRIDKANTNRTYAFIAGIVGLLVIAFLLMRNNRTRRKANILLQEQKAEIEAQKTTLETTLTELKATQAQLIQSEKMASLGELTAGIAHEIQNPLNFVNNFSDLNKELISELVEQVDQGNTEEVKEIAKDIKLNEEKINHHGKRADAIVKGMLQHSQTNKGKKESTDINNLCDEYIRLSYHGLKAKDDSFTLTIDKEFDDRIEKLNIIPSDIGRVVLNLLNNAVLAVQEKQQLMQTGYQPLVSIATKLSGNKVAITVSDNGTGVSAAIREKVFQPFFTTRPTGQGTGLGLSLSYDIAKANQGYLYLQANESADNLNDIKTIFVLELPINQAT